VVFSGYSGDCHNIAEMLLKVALNTIKTLKKLNCEWTYLSTEAVIILGDFIDV
jgi:hypothetical protein